MQFIGRWITALVLCGLLTACTEPPQETLRISAVLWPGYEPLYLASKLGYFGDEPVQLIDYLSNTDAMHAFRSHNLEAGAFTFDEVLQLLSSGVDVQVILVMDVSNGGDVILARPGIDSIPDLRGKRVAVESSAVGAYVLSRALQVHGMRLDEVTIVSTNAMEQLDSYKRGLVDAAVSFDPHRTQLLKQGMQEIFNSKSIPNEIVDVLVVRSDYAAEHPGTIRKVIEAWFRALRYQSEKPRESAAFSTHRFGSSVDEFIAGQKLLKFASEAENRTMLDPLHSPLIGNADRLYQVLAGLGIERNGVRTGSVLNPDFIP